MKASSRTLALSPASGEPALIEAEGDLARSMAELSYRTALTPTTPIIRPVFPFSAR